jgi:hypothetical protein
MELPVKKLTKTAEPFPPGTRFFDVGGVPVTWLPAPLGRHGFDSIAWDTNPCRFFSAAAAFRGRLISETEFETMRANLAVLRFTAAWEEKFRQLPEPARQAVAKRFAELPQAQRKAVPHRISGTLVAQLICMSLNRNVLAEAGRDEELVRTYSELMARLAKR